MKNVKFYLDKCYFHARRPFRDDFMDKLINVWRTVQINPNTNLTCLMRLKYRIVRVVLERNIRNRVTLETLR